MTHRNTHYHLQQQIRLRMWVVVLIIIGCINHPAIYATDQSLVEDTTKKVQENNNALLISTEKPDLTPEKDFDKIRVYESYDPITNTWSAIEDFQEVEILEDANTYHDENYIYYSFWAYDPIDHQWKRVDIREYGYQHTEHPFNVEQAITKKPKKKCTFWKNLGLTFAAGGGITSYINTINNCNLLIRKGKKEFFLQNPGAPNAAQREVYKIRWFSKRPLKIDSIEHDNVVSSCEKVKGNISFRGIGFNIPITLALHYTFFQKLRIGAGGNLEVNYVPKLYPQEAATNIMEYELITPWFYNIKWFGTLGYKILQKRKHAIFIDTQLGIVLDLGNKKASLSSLMAYEHADFYASLGAAHEIKLNDFFKFFYRCAGQYKRFHNSADFAPAKNKTSTSSITLWQPAIHLEIGTIFHFGRDKDSENQDEDINVDEAHHATTSNEATPRTEAAISSANTNHVEPPTTNHDQFSQEADAVQ